MKTSEQLATYHIRIANLVTAAGLCLLALIAGSSTILAEDDCNHPKDFATGEKCFAAQFPCPYSYLGIDGTLDYAKALNLCKANNSGAFVALMYLNGEGTPRDLQKAEAALKVWEQKNPDQFSNSQAAALEKAINGCRRAGTEACPRLDYCKDLAEATLDLEICDAAQQLSSETDFSRSIAQAKSTLSASEGAEFDGVVANFRAYQDQESGRAYDAVGNGMERGLAGTGQAAFVRDNFLKLIAETIESRKLKPVGLTTYRALKAQLDRVYERSIRRIVQSWQEDLRNPTFKDHWDEEKSYIKEYEESARESQAQWIKFRDSCADLASSLYRGQASQFDPAVSIKAAVTKLRIAELRYNPIGPESY
jgi:uncharacterized protein YecT (DUF1311 family)